MVQPKNRLDAETTNQQQQQTRRIYTKHGDFVGFRGQCQQNRRRHMQGRRGAG